MIAAPRWFWLNSGGIVMTKNLNEFLIRVQDLLENEKLKRKIDEIRDKLESELTGIQTSLGHAFSVQSFTRFQEAVKSKTRDQEKNFHQYINELMYIKDISQSMLSKRSFIKESTLSRYINGSREIPIEMIFRIALSLELNLVETENLLKKAGKGFKEASKDAVVIEAIEQGINDVMKVEAILQRFTHGSESLFSKKEREEFGFSDQDFEIEII